MTENVDTYVLPEESNRFLAEVLPTSDPLRVTWEVLTDEEKEGYLQSALWKLEDMNYIGERAWFYQPLKFPRIARGLPVNFEKAPLEVKRAQVLLASDIAVEELYVNRRNHEVCLALGLVGDTPTQSNAQKKVETLLHRWITRWRKI